MSTNQNLDYSLEHCILLVDQLNAHLGWCAARIEEEYHKLRRKDFLNRYAELIPTIDSSDDTGVNQSEEKKEPPIIQDHASLANIITQINFDLFDIKLTLRKQLPEISESRINDKSLDWLTDIVKQLSDKLPETKENAPIMPIGNPLATGFFMALNLCQQASFHLENLEGNNQPMLPKAKQYLKILEKLMLLLARWGNLVYGDREWSWDPKSEMEKNSEPLSS